MSKTYQDSSQGTVITVTRSIEDKFDLWLNRERLSEAMDEWSLREILCVRFGYCQSEGDAILEELRLNGEAIRHP